MEHLGEGGGGGGGGGGLFRFLFFEGVSMIDVGEVEIVTFIESAVLLLFFLLLPDSICCFCHGLTNNFVLDARFQWFTLWSMWPTCGSLSLYVFASLSFPIFFLCQFNECQGFQSARLWILKSFTTGKNVKLPHANGFNQIILAYYMCNIKGSRLEWYISTI